MQGTDAYLRLLEVSDPWEIKRVETQQDQHRLDIWLGIASPKRRFWFGSNQHSECKTCGRVLMIDSNADYHTWRHLNMGSFQCYVHVQLPQGRECAQGGCTFRSKYWAHTLQSTFTVSMERLIRDALASCESAADACRLLQVPMTEIKGLSVPIKEAPAATAAPATPTRPATTSVAIAGLPDGSEPIWSKMIDNEIKLDINNLGLQMLLHRLQMQTRRNPSDDFKVNKAYELHSYFVKYNKLLHHEIKQLSTVH